MHLRITICAAAIAFLLLICTSSCSKFDRLSSNLESHPSREGNCDLVFLTKLPEDSDSYIILGECRGKGMKGIVKNEFESAHKNVERCACKNGGNAILLTSGYTQGSYSYNKYGGGYTQQNAVVVVKVLYIKE